METTEKIVEAYVRDVKGWFTLPNIKCEGQWEIDLLAVDACDSASVRRYHIESGISISGGFSRLTNKPFSPTDLKVRVKQPSQRRTLGYFTERKFSGPGIDAKLKAYGFTPGNYTKVIVSWGWEKDVPDAAGHAGVVLWDFQEIVREIAQVSRTGRNVLHRRHHAHVTADGIIHSVSARPRHQRRATSSGCAEERRRATSLRHCDEDC